MAWPKRDDGAKKLQRHRNAKPERGMKLLRIWVPDPKAKGFREEALRQAALLAGAPEEADALDFIGSAAEWPQL